MLRSKTTISILVSCLLTTTTALANKSKSPVHFNKVNVSADVPLNGELIWLKKRDNTKHLLIANSRFQSRQFIWFDNLSSNRPAPVTIQIPEDVIAFNTATLANANSQTVLFFNGKDISALNFDTKTNNIIVEQAGLYTGETVYTPDSDIDFTFDFNNDGLTDLLIPDFDKTHVFIQTINGEFTKHVLELKPESQLFDDSRSFSPREINALDLNGDGLLDITYQDEDSVVVHYQLTGGGFESKGTPISLNASIADPESISAQRQATVGKTKLDYAEFVKTIDLNDDNVVDLVTRRTKQDGIFSNKGTLEVRFGFVTESGLEFNKIPDANLNYDGRMMLIGDSLRGYQFKDLNGDGLKDLYFPRKDFGFGDIIAGLISRSTDVDVEFFLMKPQQAFAQRPDMAKEVELAFDLDSESAEIPLFTIADFNGDNLDDLLTQTGSEKARLFLGDGKGPFNRRGSKHQMPFPRNGNLVSVQDINDDGKADILFRYDSTDGEQKAKTMKLWLSK